MNIPEDTWKVFMLGGFAGILYSHLIRPALKNLIQKMKHRWNSYHTLRTQRAYARGYGWAWSAVMVEEWTPDEVEEFTDSPFIQTAVEKQFDQGARQALGDIHFYKGCGGS